MRHLDSQIITYFRTLKTMRRAGGSIRAIAKTFGESKSAMHRTLSQMGQLERLDPDFYAAINDSPVPNRDNEWNGTDDVLADPAEKPHPIPPWID
jgi:hypothetical protein